MPAVIDDIASEIQDLKKKIGATMLAEWEKNFASKNEIPQIKKPVFT